MSNYTEKTCMTVHDVHYQLTEEQVEEFKEAYNLYCTELDNKIGEKELRLIMRYLGQNPDEEKLSQMINGLNPDMSGKLGYPEFLVLMGKEIMESRCSCCEETEEILNACKAFDKDGNGWIPVSSLRLVLSSYSGENLDDFIKDVIQSAELNENGEINYFKIAEW